MASIFTYDPNPPRVSSPWSASGSSTPQPVDAARLPRHVSGQSSQQLSPSPIPLHEAGLTRLEPEPQEGPTEYKLHLLLRPRRKFTMTSTGHQVPGSQHSKLCPTGSTLRTENVGAARPVPIPSNQTRQARLQQLTTQLLWRLQQSSPFHSSSSADLVLPVLPEANPRLDIPAKPSKLLPGLEESQGALYEIGVSDDGTFIGLTEDELEESLTNLAAMASSLGCVVEVLRKVIVGDCRWDVVNDQNEIVERHKDQLWVAEALVRPDLDSSTELSQATSSLQLGSLDIPGTDSDVKLDDATKSRVEQLRVSLIGSSTSGKSSLLGTLTTSTFDNGRGKSRLSLLKHRHEIASGITSSVAQELLGYRATLESEYGGRRTRGINSVVNYASGNVSSWNDMHNLSDRLVFLSDSPGLAKFSKSTIRTLTSWNPHWTILCVAADDSEDNSEPGVDMTLSHLELCLKLRLQLMIVITKMDSATKSGLRQTLAKLLSALKSNGRKPSMLSNSPAPGSRGSVSFQGPSGHPDGPELDKDSSKNILQQISIEDEEESQRVLSLVKADHDVVPILLTSSVTGSGIGKLHALLRALPLSEINEIASSAAAVQEKSTRDEKLSVKAFHVDEVFAMPPSKVYNPSSSEVSKASQGVVLCGLSASDSISIGSELLLGPFAVDRAGAGLPREHSPGPFRTSSQAYLLTDRPSFLFGGNSPITAGGSPHIQPSTDTKPTFINVRVVSIRNLRLPVRSLLSGQVGTIGVEQVPGSAGKALLRRARRGMVLVPPSTNLTAYRSFTASFPSSDFASATSPPLILGGHAIVYINSIRAAVKVTAVALAEPEATSDPPSPVGDTFFAFDSGDEDEAKNPHNDDDDEEEQDQKRSTAAATATAALPPARLPPPPPGNNHGVGLAADCAGLLKITFRFVSSLEWFQPGDRVLVIPNLVTAGPVAGPAAATPTASGLAGFVGTVLARSEEL